MVNRRELTKFLEDEFTKLLENQRIDITSGNLEGYEYVFKSRLCILKLIENHFTDFVRNFKI